MKSSLLKFIINDAFEKVLVLCPEQGVAYTKDVLNKFLPNNEVEVTVGGASRNGTIMNAIRYIEDNYGMDDDTVLVTHDSVRPFVTQRIIDDNIACAKEGIPCDTMIPATDTIVESIDGKYIENIPNRAHYYQGQTPQGFKAKDFKELYESLSKEEKTYLLTRQKSLS